LAGFINVYTKCASLPNSECHVGSIYFVQISFTQLSHAKIDAAFREAHLNNVCIQVQEGKGGHAAHVDAGLARLQLHARILVHPKLVAYGDGAVLGRAAPFAISSGLHGNRTIEVADTGDPCGRILVLIRSCVWRN
jgi:hypothetical protein